MHPWQAYRLSWAVSFKSFMYCNCVESVSYIIVSFKSFMYCNCVESVSYIESVSYSIGQINYYYGYYSQFSMYCVLCINLLNYLTVKLAVLNCQ